MIEIQIAKDDKPEIRELKKLLLDKVISVPEASKITGYGSTTIYRWLSGGKGFYRGKVMRAIKKLREARVSI